MDKRHGQIGEGDRSHVRWCDGCDQWHGIYYPCEEYDAETLAVIEHQSQRFVRNMNDPQWIKKQDAPAWGLRVFKEMIGLS